MKCLLSIYNCLSPSVNLIRGTKTRPAHCPLDWLVHMLMKEIGKTKSQEYATHVLMSKCTRQQPFEWTSLIWGLGNLLWATHSDERLVSCTSSHAWCGTHEKDIYGCNRNSSLSSWIRFCRQIAGRPI